SNVIGTFLILSLGVLLSILIMYGFDVYQGVRVYDITVLYCFNMIIHSIATLLNLSNRNILRKILCLLILFVLVSAAMLSIFPNSSLTEWRNPIFPEAPFYTVNWLNDHSNLQTQLNIAAAGVLGRYLSAFAVSGLNNRYNGYNDQILQSSLDSYRVPKNFMVIFPLDEIYAKTLYLPYLENPEDYTVYENLLLEQSCLIYNSGIGIFVS
ncbi:MAG: hypothetical protein ACPL3B_06900, partial [Fervidobacterium sp.]